MVMIKHATFFNFKFAHCGARRIVLHCGASMTFFSSRDVRWAPDGEPFSRAFSVSAHSQKLWIQAEDRSGVPLGEPMHLMLKGTNWAGFQANGCVHELWKHSLQNYLDRLVDNHFNAVRLPLSLALVAADSWIITGTEDAEHPRCGHEYQGLETLAILDDVVERLRAIGVFVMLDMHTQSHPEFNQGCWENSCCTGDKVCDEAMVERFIEAWRKLARRYCAQPNVIMADLFNEPHDAYWGEGAPEGADWGLFAERLGNEVLAICPRWLIVVEGVGNNNRACGHAGHGGCWWGENILGMLRAPIRLSLPNRLVLSPHVYGHGNHPYMKSRSFPRNMPGVWTAHWYRVAVETGVPVVLGEWGGVWVQTTFHGDKIKATATWQHAMRDFLLQHNISSFYWTLNDNSFKTGSLYNGPHSREKLELLSPLLSTSIMAVQAAWYVWPPEPPSPPPSPPVPPVPPVPPPPMPPNTPPPTVDGFEYVGCFAGSTKQPYAMLEEEVHHGRKTTRVYVDAPSRAACRELCSAEGRRFFALQRIDVRRGSHTNMACGCGDIDPNDDASHARGKDTECNANKATKHGRADVCAGVPDWPVIGGGTCGGPRRNSVYRIVPKSGIAPSPPMPPSTPLVEPRSPPSPPSPPPSPPSPPDPPPPPNEPPSPQMPPLRPPPRSPPPRPCIPLPPPPPTRVATPPSSSSSSSSVTTPSLPSTAAGAEGGGWPFGPIDTSAFLVLLVLLCALLVRCMPRCCRGRGRGRSVGKDGDDAEVSETTSPPNATSTARKAEGALMRAVRGASDGTSRQPSRRKPRSGTRTRGKVAASDAECWITDGHEGETEAKAPETELASSTCRQYMVRASRSGAAPILVIDGDDDTPPGDELEPPARRRRQRRHRAKRVKEDDPDQLIEAATEAAASATGQEVSSSVDTMAEAVDEASAPARRPGGRHGQQQGRRKMRGSSKERLVVAHDLD